MGRRPGLTLDLRNMTIGMLTIGMKNKEIARQFHVSESSIYRLRTKFRQTAVLKTFHVPADHVRRPVKRTNNIVTSSRRDRFPSGAKIAGLVRNATGTGLTWD